MHGTYRNQRGNEPPTRFCRNHPDREARTHSDLCPECDGATEAAE